LALATDFENFLHSLDDLHYFINHQVFRSKQKGPSFRCESAPDGTFILHYYSRRSGLYPIVKGFVKEVARRIFNTEIEIKLTGRNQEHGDMMLTEHVIFSVTQASKRVKINKDVSFRLRLIPRFIQKSWWLRRLQI
jgi:hypothetical protein